MPKHGAIWLYVHGNQKAYQDGQPRPEILQQGDSQVSEPCHDKPVNGVALGAGGWRQAFHSSGLRVTVAFCS